MSTREEQLRRLRALNDSIQGRDRALGDEILEAFPRRNDEITGPCLEDDDSVLFKVRCPVAFWKIIAFIHDETRQLCATGYEMSQDQSLPQEEFVFGNFASPQLNITTQVPIRSIELRSGISFGGLVAIDPLSNEEGPGDGQGVRLDRMEQIRFT